MADIIKDEVFGELEFDRYVWWRSIGKSLLGQDVMVELLVQDENQEGILDVQRKAYQTYLENEEKYIREVPKYILDYYKWNYEEIDRVVYLEADKQKDTIAENSKNLSIYKETVPQTLLCYFLDHFEKIDKVVELSEDAQKDTIKAERIFRMFMIMSLYFDRKGNFGWICRFSWEDNGLAILLSEDKPRILTPNQLRNYRKIDDPVFGEMIYNEVWEKSEKKLLYGKEKLVTIAACDYAHGITDVHRACYKEYQENEAKYLEEIPRVLLEYYLANFDEIKEYWRVPRAYAKKNITQENIMELIDFDCLYFIYDGTFAWLCECAWDEEDAGLAFVMGDGKVRVELQTDVL